MAFNYSYRFTEKAQRDLESILKYIDSDLNNRTAAQTLGRKIFATIDSARNFPESGKLVENEFLSDKTVRRLLVDNYTVFYKAEKKENTLYVLRIVYGKSNLDEILRKI